MMQKLCRAVLFVGCSLQIVLGICWMIMNFPHVQMFGESALYVEISKNFICDEYEGILYPALILLARGIEKIFPIPYYCTLYFVQLAVALVAGYAFLHTVGVKSRKWLIWGGLVLVTFPMALQCHLAVLPQSLVASALLLELGACLLAIRGEYLKASAFVRVLAFWLVGALLQPEYLYLGAVPVLVLFVYGVAKAWKCPWKKHRRSILHYVILMLAFAGIITGMHSLTQVEGYYGRTHQSLNLHLASRCVWRYVHLDSEYWRSEVRTLFTPEQVQQTDYYADNVERIVGRTLEQNLGVEAAREVLGEIAGLAWDRHKRNIVHDAAWDMVGYTFSPLVVQRQFIGKAYDSYSGSNYDVMRMQSPGLTEVFLNYGCWWFALGMVLAVLMQVLVLLREKRSFWNVGKLTALLGWALTVLALVFYYTMQGAGMMDYKKSIAVTLLWLIWMLATGVREDGKGERTC